MKLKRIANVALKRHVIPIDFDEIFISELKIEAADRGLKLAPYLRSLVVTHPDRKKRRQRG
jgi:hypothetical protein